MAPNTISSRGAIGDDEESRHASTSPASFSRNSWREPCLPIDANHGLVGITDGRLDLERGQHAGRRVTADDVDRPAFAEDRERHFDIDVPVVRFQQLDCGVDGRGVAFVEQTVDALPLPSDVQLEPSTDGLRYGDEITPGDPVEIAALDSTDDAPRQAGAIAEVDLSPAATLPQSANDPTKPPSVHVSVR